MPMQKPTSAEILVIMGDVHANLPLALRGLERIEEEYGQSIAQVLSVGDLGLFLDPLDWNFLSGPKKHRHPERTPAILEAWKEWRWPLAMIGGNHEPWHKLRDFKPGDFGPRLTFTNAGALSHTVKDLRVYGLSGIYHPDHLEYYEAGVPERARAKSWADLVRPGKGAQISPKRLTYYKREELESLLALPAAPHLLLTHDWPKEPAGTHANFATRPERHLAETLRPQYVCCGHHHRAEAFRLAASECRALSIIQDREPSTRESIRPGWAWVCQWEPTACSLSELGYWPSLPAAVGSE